MLLLPAAIDMLNRRNILAIQKMEAAATHLRTLQQLLDQLGGELRDYGHGEPVTEHLTGRLICWSTRGHQLVMTPIHRIAQAAA